MLNRFFPVLLMMCLLAVGACATKNGAPAPGPGQTVDKDGNIIYLDSPAGDEEDEKLLEESISLNWDSKYVLSEQEKAVLDSYTPTMFDVRDQDREEVQAHFVFFTHKIRDRFSAWLERSQYYLPYMKKVFNERGLPEELIYLPFVESGFNPKVTSVAGARGMWQFMPSTGRIYGLNNDWWVDERRDPYKATEAAADYLTKLYCMFGDWYLAVAAYNAGEGKIQRALAASGCETFFDLSDKNHTLRGKKTKLMLETQHYVPRFLAVLKIVRNLESLGFAPLKWDQAPELVNMEVPGGTDLKSLARTAGMNWDEFYSYNMAFRRFVTPPDRTSTVYLPKKYQAAALNYIKHPVGTPDSGYTMYTVKAGDTLSNISKRTGIPAAALSGVNDNMQLTAALKAGTVLRLPGGALVNDDKAAGKQVAASSKKSGGYYKVKKGDTVYSLAKRFGLSQTQLLQANGKSTKKPVLKIGESLYIPNMKGGGSAKKTTVASNSKKNNASAKKTTAQKSNSDKKAKTQAKSNTSTQKKSTAKNAKAPAKNTKASDKNTAKNNKKTSTDTVEAAPKAPAKKTL